MNVKVKIGFILFLAVCVIMASGFLSYKSLSSIVAYIHTEKLPESAMNRIENIAQAMEQAEQGIRIYTTIGDENYLEPYYKNRTLIYDELDLLRDEKVDEVEYKSLIDTLNFLIDEKFYVWNEILVLYNDYNIERIIEEISVEIDSMQVQQQRDSSNRKLLRRLFSRKKTYENRISENQKIIQQIETLKQLKESSNELREKKEIQLSITSSQITKKIYAFIDALEREEETRRELKALEAEKLSQETYLWIASFSIFGTLLALAAVIILTRFLRKTNQYQKALQQSKQVAEDLVKAKEIFIANVSHELRTPLNSISGFTEQLLRDPELKEEYLKIIKYSSDHLLQLINDLLDYSKLQSGKLELRPVHFKTAELIDGVLSVFKLQAEKQQVQLKTDIHKDVPHVLYGDDSQLRQIIINLVGNAIKFSPQGTVSLSLFADEILNGHFTLRVEVKDTGIGIESGKLESIFQDFTQEALDTSRKYGGTGLGLAIVKSLIDLHQGEIKVSSEKNKGSVFTCLIPYQKGDKKQIEAINGCTEWPDLNEKKILVVDDEEYNRRLLRVMLTRWGAEVYEATNGKEAIEQIGKQTFDVVFLDMRMPLMDGYETVAYFKKHHESALKNTSLFGISAVMDEPAMQLEKNKSITAFILKPLTEQAIIKALKLARQFKATKTKVAGKHHKQVNSGNVQKGILNLEELKRIAGNDTTFVNSMLEKLIEVTDAELKNLNASIRANDWEATSNIAHKMASPCRHVGADELSNQFKAMMIMAEKTQDRSALPELFSEIQATYANLRQEIQAYLNTH
jgi:signal transduction histidine kinase/DNA-binding response OmpR family regulator